MMIREKKIGTLSTEIGPVATKIVKFWPKKAFISKGTKNTILVIYGIRLKFKSSGHLEHFKYLN